MKKIFKPLTIIILTLFLFSCTKDEDPVTIGSVLSVSKQQYNNAENNSWVEVTKEEYENVFSKLQETTKVGLGDDKYEEDITKLSRGGADFTLVNHGVDAVKLPANSYIIAFKYSPKNPEDITNTQVKMNSNSDPKLGYSNVGDKLPTHKGGAIKYFVIKNNNNKTTSEGHLAFYLAYSRAGWSDLSDINMTTARGDKNELVQTDDSSNNHIQAISTTKKQW